MIYDHDAIHSGVLVPEAKLASMQKELQEYHELTTTQTAKIRELQDDLVDYRRGAVFMTKQIQGLRAENAKLKEIIKRMRLDVCRLEYGDDFDSCSTQEREGCGSCAYLNNFETAYLAKLDKEGESR